MTHATGSKSSTMQGGASSSHHYDMKHEMDDSDDLSGEWSPPFLRFSFFFFCPTQCHLLPPKLEINFIIPKKFLKILWISLTNSSNFLVICILNRKTRWFSKTWVKLNWNWLYHWHLSTCKRMSIWWTKGPMLSGGASAVIHYTPAAVLEPLTMSPRDAPSVHSPLHLPSTSFLNSHITKSVAAYSFSLASNNQFLS